MILAPVVAEAEGQGVVSWGAASAVVAVATPDHRVVRVCLLDDAGGVGHFIAGGFAVLVGHGWFLSMCVYDTPRQLAWVTGSGLLVWLFQRLSFQGRSRIQVRWLLDSGGLNVRFRLFSVRP